MPRIVVAMTPEIVAKNKKALTAKPLFWGEIVLTTMVIAHPIQDSATRYSSARPSIAIENPLVVLSWDKVHIKMVGIPKPVPMIHTKALA